MKAGPLSSKAKSLRTRYSGDKYTFIDFNDSQAVD
jgi:hypothetical protein